MIGSSRPIERPICHVDTGIRTEQGRNWNRPQPAERWRLAPEPLANIEVDGVEVGHYAAFPRELPRRCILAGTSAKGVCPSLRLALGEGGGAKGRTIRMMAKRCNDLGHAAMMV